ncbi:MAG: hypothetical protein JWM74_4149 [Myxococcaceae bacterium]|nr:hypothetical protein [Myxococcaceae bacterium]
MALRSIGIGLACAFAIGCTAITSDQGPVASGSEDIVSVPQTDLERQSIGNTWIYAHVTWVESMHATATGEAFDVSASYWTYWHWFDQVAGGVATTLSTGGNWETANGIVRKYGLAHERAFVVADATIDMSARQASALAVVNASLQTGALSVPGARKDKALVRKELDRAWALGADVTSMLDRVFGADVSRTFSSLTSPADPTGTDIQRAADFAVAYATAPGTPNVQRHLDQAMREWRQVYYAAADRRSTQIRVQQALHDAQPVLLTWFVDFNALEDRDNGRLGSFNMTTLNELGSGVQGGDMTVIDGYRAKLADGRTLEAGQTLDPTKPEDKSLLDTALLPSTQVELFRVKNAWGSAHPERAFAPGMPAYNDLALDYLDGPVKKCVQRNGVTDTTSCPTTTTPLQNVVLPPGY